MSAQIIDGRAIAAQVRAEIRSRIERTGVTPGFVDLLIGEDPASQTYVRLKYTAAGELGIKAFDHILPANTTREDALKIIDSLNVDPAVHGLMVQGPLPKECSVDIFELQNAILPSKDVDGLHAENQGLLMMGRPRYVGATPAGVIELLKRSGISAEGKHAVIIGRSTLVTRPLAILLSLKEPGLNATVTVCHTGTKHLAHHTRDADILVAAAGAGPRITADMIKQGATVIDVATRAKPGGGLTGDVEFDEVKEVAGAITPVPGGVGPMTVAMLMHNVAVAAGA